MEELEGTKWSSPPPNAAPLERDVFELRRRPVEGLSAWELARLIGQHVGLEFLVPHSLNRLIAEQEQGLAFLDDDLLSALLSCGEYFRKSDPALTRQLLSFVESLDEEGPYWPHLVGKFRATVKQ
ncbi:contact-dependent growth inhibition system immunity protein [Streptomyces sp. NPDC102384]|uniref:contact-dependent growth inhibition system immunity protein n=1 Tax=Streptomyces sp. NPDC102384 TaxID=3366166 RepID=UPI00382C5467